MDHLPFLFFSVSMYPGGGGGGGGAFQLDWDHQLVEIVYNENI